MKPMRCEQIQGRGKKITEGNPLENAGNSQVRNAEMGKPIKEQTEGEKYQGAQDDSGEDHFSCFVLRCHNSHHS